MKRLFFALWPEESTRQQIDAVNANINLDGVRKLKPSNLHVTLLFLGNTAPDIAAEITSKAGLIKSPEFSFQFDGIEQWHESKTICLTTSKQPDELHYLVNQLVNIAKDYSIYLHDRPYRSHITLMRKAKTPYTLAFQPILWTAKDFVLVESISTDDGIVYKVLERWSLTSI